MNKKIKKEKSESVTAFKETANGMGKLMYNPHEA
jgi:hypothetical protein